MQNQLLDYRNTLQSLINRGDANEHSFRTAFEVLLNTLKPTQDIRIIHEPKSKEGQGNIRPDFKIVRQIPQEKGGYESLVGFIECKNFGADLSPLVKGKQIAKYLSVCHNIILTDYNRFILLNYDKIEVDFTLFKDFKSTPTQAESIKIQNNFSHLLQKFFGTTALITDRDELVKVLSSQSFYLRETISEARSNDLSFKEYFEKSYQSFSNLEHTDLPLVEFCDILAQSIVYGMFVAHIDNELFEIDKIPTASFAMILPEHFAILKEFIGFSLPLTNLPESIKYTLENIIKTITLIHKPTFKNEIRNITTYLYEDFLLEYDRLSNMDKKKSGGVYYTPEPIVSMIVRSIDELLKTHFGKDFSSERVKVLDFATGTGSFLAKVFELILDNQSAVFAKETIINKCFRDIYGFEISFVPYIVAHLKLSSLLKSKGFSDFSANQKFQVFLTNTLDLDAERKFQLQVPFDNLKNERNKSLEIKHKEDLLVILGNPPYNVKSKNKHKEILTLLDSYKMGLNEQNIQPLDDDYIKFIRFAQWKLLEQNKNYGIMGFITNNSYLNGRTHRKMRESLAKTFDEIYILNLHGNNEIDGKNDKNVFDIRVGVCISIFVKYEPESSLQDSRIESTPSLRDSATPNRSNPNKEKYAQIHYFSTKDNEILRRKDKFALLNKVADKGLKSIKWKKIKLDSPYFWFVPKSFKSNEYNKFWALAKNKALGESKGIFETCNCGTNTRKDNLLIQFSKDKIKTMLNDMQNLPCESILQKYHFSETKDWTINEQRENFSNPNEKDIIKITHRPFDSRFIFYPLDKINKIIPRGDSRKEIMKHFLKGENLGICFEKGLNSQNVSFISDKMIEGHCVDGRTYIAPLYCYDSNLNRNSKTPNFTQEFSAYIAKHKVLKSKTPEQILAFIYANLYNPAYRAKYLEYLKIGFPRIDFEASESKFESLANLGQNLIDLHLMKTIPQDKSIDLVFRANADRNNPNFTLDKPKYENEKIVLNADLEIVGVSAEVWDYTIGGYKVIDKWLKYRANDKNGAITLEQSDFTHILNVAKILKATIVIQTKLAEI